jgi:hypothetical protein
MPADVIDQLGMAGELLDRVVRPVTFEDVVGAGADRSVRSPVDARPRTLIELAGADRTSDERGQRGFRRFIGAAAASIIGIGVLGVSWRGLNTTSTDEPATGVPSLTSEVVEAGLVDPRENGDWPADAFPADAVLRFTAPLGRHGQLWVYDLRTSGGVCTVRVSSDGKEGCGVFDAATYDSGQAWALQGDPASSAGTLLWGVVPPSLRVTVTAGDTTVTADDDGLWFLEFPDDANEFTITTPTSGATISVRPTSVQTTLPTVDDRPGAGSSTTDGARTVIDSSAFVPQRRFSSQLSNVTESPNEVSFGDVVVTTRRTVGGDVCWSITVAGESAGLTCGPPDDIDTGAAFLEVDVSGRQVVAGLVPDEIVVVTLDEMTITPVDNVYAFDVTGRRKGTLTVSDGTTTVVIGGSDAPSTDP